MKREELVDYLANEISSIEKPHPVRVGIDGPDAAGKTSLGDELAKKLEFVKRQIIRVSLDGFQHSRLLRYEDKGGFSADGYYEDAFDFNSIRWSLLNSLGPNGSRHYLEAIRDLKNDLPLPTIHKKADDNAILIADGVFLYRPELEQCWDFGIFLDIDKDVALNRAYKRDRFLGDHNAVKRKYEQRYFPAQARYQQESSPRAKANVVINNNDIKNPVIINGRKL